LTVFHDVFTVFTMSDHHEKILACACELYLEGGLDGFSMRKLARHVGVTAPALYRHFESREEVLAGVVREAHREFTAEIYRALEARTPLERFFRAAEGYLDFALKHPRWYYLLFIAPERLGMETLPDDIEAMGSAIHQFWVDRVRECQDAGILKPGDPVQVSLTMWAHAHGMLSLYHHGHFRMDEGTFRRQFEVSGALLLAGLASDSFAAELGERYADAPTVGARDTEGEEWG
jgi:AcrR family transcriptional regulator